MQTIIKSKATPWILVTAGFITVAVIGASTRPFWDAISAILIGTALHYTLQARKRQLAKVAQTT